MTEPNGASGGPHLAHHLTCVVNGFLPLFSQPEVVAILCDCLGELRAGCGLRLYAWVVMEEHLHLLVGGERPLLCLERFREESCRRIAALLEERRLERFLLRLPRREGRCRVWQEPAEVEPVTAEMLGAVAEYIHINPVKRGYVERPEQWRYSSARGGEGLVAVDRW